MSTHKDDCENNICAINGDVDDAYESWDNSYTVTISSLNQDCRTCGRVPDPLQCCSKLDNSDEYIRQIKAAFDNMGVLSGDGCNSINDIIDELNQPGNTIIIWVARYYEKDTNNFESINVIIYTHDCTKNLSTRQH